ncbi:MAG TPA: N(G),N(G)-dimethylarginine dimethylaminohydrolase [Candidatus Saccharimonadales bacterium]|nr:N(G),N(G)-dimethylarginine dimethylaminohydrolase [Candidatus Saccharimonadales bacterium]
MTSRIAITRAVSPALGRCELSFVERRPIDVAAARRQHREYEACLEALGCGLLRLPAEAELPDSVFVEDVAVVLDELAVITRPGAESRRAECAGVAVALRPYRRLAAIQAPGTLDGGDVLAAGRHVFVGRSTRTNEDGITQLRQHLGPLGYAVEAVAVAGCLHLKSAATAVGPDQLLVHPGRVDPAAFAGLRLLEVDPAEPDAANVLRVGDTVVAATAHPRTRRRLSAAGLEVRTVDLSELAKAEGALTCCSLIFQT